MRRILVLFAHPALEKSRVNRRLIRRAETAGVTRSVRRLTMWHQGWTPEGYGPAVPPDGFPVAMCATVR